MNVQKVTEFEGLSDEELLPGVGTDAAVPQEPDNTDNEDRRYIMCRSYHFSNTLI